MSWDSSPVAQLHIRPPLHIRCLLWAGCQKGDLAYNIGVPAFQGLTLVRKFNRGDTAGAADEFPRWNKSNGEVLLGLRRRRAADRAMFLGATGANAIKIGAAVT
jgi:hypothetical protein